MSAAPGRTPAPVDVLTFGETMLAAQLPGSLAVGAQARTTVAGAESNVAIGLARLGHRAAWAGLVGDDEPGRLVLRTLRGEGVDITRAATRATAPTGAMLREQRVADLVRVHYWRSGSAASLLTPADIEPALGDGARVLHLTGITCALGPGPLEAARAAAAHAHARGWTVALDVNHRQRLWTAEEAGTALRPLLPHVTVLIASDDELPVVSGAFSDSPDGEERAVDALLDSGVREVVVKRGGEGAAYRDRQGVRHSVPALRVPVRDTVGAGDAFCAGYLSGLLDGLPPAGRLARANTLGAFAVASDGDWEGLPRRDELGLLAAAPGTAIR
ncbi:MULTISPECIES: sugar kinase [Streptomyces]|uniref:Sugar kinase n=1 Tax=Streptomyces glycanivorans TaxID=3033808 RepID=A0ABY9JMX0_9ACTN|nr:MULTISPECIES: sugar kinase [unclassified Streptomyces]WSQ81450.1 sugar kinase [Streptomyces sp. NBC_01213]TXS12641.1 sugar kinase [Streptomyces sp. wa22]WLQ68094.1 sugar kinase [Streptomyces sp. Alt3]WSQ88777.1 sugar kinase [Streptomyces sp. NBC_01212]WSR05218.1 sugar kinase [Streptomyces sp. NBC_01208]